MTARLGADRIGHEGPVEDHSLFGKPVDIGCFVPVRPIGGDSLIGMIIGKDEEGVQRFGGQRDLTGQGKCGEEEGLRISWQSMETTCFCLGN